MSKIRIFKIMKTISSLHVLILLLIIPQVLFSQVKSENPYFVKRFEIGGSSSDSMWEYGYDISVSMAKITSDRLIIRLCSKETLPIAISTAAVEPLTLTNFLSSSKGKPSISSERIFVDRSETCGGRLTSNTATELWLIDGKNHLPNSKEEIKICQFQMQELKSRKDNKKEVNVGTYSHELALKKLVSLLKKDSEAVGIIIGYYAYNPTIQIRTKLKFAERFLKKSGLPANKYEIRMMRWTGIPDIEEPQYLSVRTIKITEGCIENKKTGEVIWVD